MYRDNYPDQARRLALLGLSDAEVAEYFEVDVRTIYRWDVDHPEFCQARARGKLPADGKVAEKLYHRALGYSHEDVHVSNYKGSVTLTPLIKHYPPETDAARWWLKNRRSDKWRDRIEHTGAEGGPVMIVTGVVRDADP